MQSKDPVCELKTEKGLGLNELRDSAHKTAISKGWYDDERNPLELLMLVVREVSEAVEELRDGTPMFYWDDENPKKPMGESIEIADAMIRLFDYAGWREIDLDEAIRVKMAFNLTRPNRHGGKKF